MKAFIKLNYLTAAARGGTCFAPSPAQNLMGFPL